MYCVAAVSRVCSTEAVFILLSVRHCRFVCQVWSFADHCVAVAYYQYTVVGLKEHMHAANTVNPCFLY